MDHPQISLGIPLRVVGIGPSVADTNLAELGDLVSMDAVVALDRFAEVGTRICFDVSRDR